jgi:RNA polymerase primary sigma factor
MRQGDQGIAVYMREVGRVPLLTPKEEKQLARRVRKKDEAARSQMILANLRLVVKIAGDYAQVGLPLLDLISEGNIGLAKAVDRFDPSRGVKFSTYAAWWIKCSIKRALVNQSKTIRLPAYLVGRISRMHKAHREMTQELGREPRDQELADRLGVPLTDVGFWRTANQQTTSLDEPTSENGRLSVGDLLWDHTVETPCDKMINEQLLQEVREMLNNLEERERNILIRRYGLNGTERQTLDTVGRKFKITRERVRQIQETAVSKLRVMIDQQEQPRHEFLVSAL